MDFVTPPPVRRLDPDREAREAPTETLDQNHSPAAPAKNGKAPGLGLGWAALGCRPVSERSEMIAE